MASGSFSTAFTPYDYKLIVEWSSKATTSTNSSVITANIYLDIVYTLRTSAHSGSKITINGVDYTFDSPTINADGDKVKIATITSNAIKHNDNGKKSVSIVCDYAVNATISGTYYGIITASKTVELDLIPRQATLTAAPNFNDEDNPEITYSNPAGSVVDSLQAAIYSSDGSTAYASYRNITKTASTYTFNLTTTERNRMRNAIPDAKSMTVKFYVKTVIGDNTYYSSISKTFSIVNGNPTFSPTIEDVDSKTLALTGDSSKLIRYYSNAAITIGASAIKGATLTSSEVSNSGKTLTEDGTIANVKSGTFTFYAKDSRGNTGTATVNQPFVNYVKLTANFKPTITVDGLITFTVSGNYFNGTFGAVENVLSLSYRYKAADGEYGDWQVLAPSVSSDSYECEVSFTIPDFDYRSNYTFQVSAADKLVSLQPEYVASALPIFDWSKDDFNFNVPVSMETLNGNSVNGLFNALTTRYEMSPTITPGENYTSAEGTCYLFGSTARMYITAKRSSSAAAGNIDNETVATVVVPHGGKIKGSGTTYFVFANNGSVGYAGSFEYTDTEMTFTITLSSVGTASSTFTSYFLLPLTIDVNAYV